jgi:cytochrome c oxidase assembly protein subunit 15
MKIMNKIKYTKIIKIWLWIGLIMLIGQVVLGGITRLTGSGLSITRWDIITGVIPPLNAEDWMLEFAMYKKTPQFHKINSTFTIEQFKFIYLWEYLHRLWVRSLGMIFLIPFIGFVIKKMIDWFLVKRLLIVVILTMITASAGWIMVQSGLVDRPWVDAYKLTIHFVLAIIVIAAMVKTIFDCMDIDAVVTGKSTSLLYIVLGLTFFQLILSGLMAGMKAGLYFPSWPDMNGRFIPEVLLSSQNWLWDNMQQYDSIPFAPALVHFSHRTLAYLLIVLTIILFIKFRNVLTGLPKKALNTSLYLVLVQVILGILIVLNIQGKIPLIWGVSHQLVGLLYFLSLYVLVLSVKKQ